MPTHCRIIRTCLRLVCKVDKKYNIVGPMFEGPPTSMIILDRQLQVGYCTSPDVTFLLSYIQVIAPFFAQVLSYI